MSQAESKQDVRRGGFLSFALFLLLQFGTFEFVGEVSAAVHNVGSDLGTRKHRLQQTENLHIQLP